MAIDVEPMLGCNTIDVFLLMMLEYPSDAPFDFPDRLEMLLRSVLTGGAMYLYCKTDRRERQFDTEAGYKFDNLMI